VEREVPGGVGAGRRAAGVQQQDVLSLGEIAFVHQVEHSRHRFTRVDGIEERDGQSMLAWPHSGFHVHDGVWVAADDREFAVRLARYCARNPVALSRLEYRSDTTTVTYHSDKPTGPTAGSETLDVLEFVGSRVSTYGCAVGKLGGFCCVAKTNFRGEDP
jgi:hypothetical protein